MTANGYTCINSIDALPTVLAELAPPPTQWWLMQWDELQIGLRRAPDPVAPPDMPNWRLFCDQIELRTECGGFLALWEDPAISERLGIEKPTVHDVTDGPILLLGRYKSSPVSGFLEVRMPRVMGQLCVAGGPAPADGDHWALGTYTYRDRLTGITRFTRYHGIRWGKDVVHGQVSADSDNGN
jgi:hypothetical protein